MKNLTSVSVKRFQKKVYIFYAKHKRTLPWRWVKDPYKILVSEIMLQQTQVDRVIPKYEVFLKRFPTLASLARASNRAVLEVWQGLGYNRRAIYLRDAAQQIVKVHKGKMPHDTTALVALPGVGEGTAGALQAFAFNMPTAFLETNIRTVFIKEFFPRSRKVSEKTLHAIAEQTLDKKNPREWYYALMDYGSFLKANEKNYSRHAKNYTKQSKFSGSDRQIRGRLLKILLTKPSARIQELSFLVSTERLEHIIAGLTREGLIHRHRDTLSIT